MITFDHSARIHIQFTWIKILIRNSIQSNNNTLNIESRSQDIKGQFLNLGGSRVLHEMGLIHMKRVSNHKFIIRIILNYFDNEPMAISKDRNLDHENTLKSFEGTPYIED